MFNGLGIAVRRLLRVPKLDDLSDAMPNGFLLLIKTPLPLCAGEPPLMFLPTLLAVLSFFCSGWGVGVGAGAGGGLGLLGAHIKISPFLKSLSHVRVFIQKKFL